MTEGVWGDSEQLGEAHDALCTARLMHELGDGNRKTNIIGVGGDGAVYLETGKGHRESPWRSSEGLAISKAVGMGLCRCRKEDDIDLKKEITMIVGTTISKKEHIALMNAAYVATSINVKLNLLWIGNATVDIPLEQAVSCTSGISLSLPEKSSLLQVLFQVLLTPDVPGSISIPPPTSVDTRISCFKSNDLIDIGLVCPVCFSVYAIEFKDMKQCETCSTALG